MILQRIMWLSIVCASEQWDPQYSMQTYYHPNQQHWGLYPVELNALLIPHTESMQMIVCIFQFQKPAT